jgi:hypothetical protein
MNTNILEISSLAGASRQEAGLRLWKLPAAIGYPVAAVPPIARGNCK